MRIYIAGPYRAKMPTDVDRNILVAREAMADLFRLGHTPFCPHAMTAGFEHDFPDIDDGVYLRTDLEWLDLCDAILMLPGWERSTGACAELEYARSERKDIYFSANDVPRRLG